VRDLDRFTSHEIQNQIPNLFRLFGVRAMLKEVGIDPVDEPSIVQAGHKLARIAPIFSGNVNGTVVNAPLSNEAERLKWNLLADSAKMNIPYSNKG
jgi:hypothetical protein